MRWDSARRALACVRAPARGASPNRRRVASERGSGARGATDRANETTPNPQPGASRERGRGLTEGSRCAGSQHAGQPTEHVALCVPARGARPTRRRGAFERESGARGATDGTNETTPNPQRRAALERGRGLTESARRADYPRRPTARVALGVRPRARSWCAPHPPARGLGLRARERRARGDGRDERNDARGGGVKGNSAEGWCFRALRFSAPPPPPPPPPLPASCGACGGAKGIGRPGRRE